MDLEQNVCGLGHDAAVVSLGRDVHVAVNTPVLTPRVLDDPEGLPVRFTVTHKSHFVVQGLGVAKNKKNRDINLHLVTEKQLFVHYK